ncbi:MAG: prolyl oligopeptidase family serine peptidase [Limisphaerales bacterium]
MVDRVRCRLFLALLALVFLPGTGLTQKGYQRPPNEVLEILNAPVTPGVLLSPSREHLLLVDRERYPSIAELAQPMLPLAGLRINPDNNGPHLPPNYTGITIQDIPGGKQRAVKLSTNARIGFPSWAPNGKQFAFAMYHPNRIELWIVDARSAKARKVSGLQLNETYGEAFQWLRDSQTLLCRSVPEKRLGTPTQPQASTGPVVMESTGRTSPVRTHQDLLRSASDDALFEHYVTSQLVLVDSANGRKRKLGEPAIFGVASPSPDGNYFLVSQIRKPYSRSLPVSGFGRRAEIWDRQANAVYKLPRLRSEEGIPIGGVRVGPRNYRWRPSAPATLVWVEALDGGNPKTEAEHRDKIMALRAPFEGEAEDIFRLEHRFSTMIWGEHEGMALVSEYDRERRWSRTFLVKFDSAEEPARLIRDRSAQDRYGDLGSPMMRTLPTGERVIWQTGDFIYLQGAGASPRGDFPFLDRYNLRTLQTERVFQCDESSYEAVVALVDDKGPLRFITRHESPSSPPNYFLCEETSSERIALTSFQDPAPQLRNIRRQLVTYQREDGVPLSFNLLLPPDYQPGERLPTVVWAYPREYNDPETAGQISGSTNRFTTISGSSHLFFLTQGYAVLDGATMPIVGSPQTMNDTFIEQIVASAKAAIDKAVELGVTDPNRVGIGGHSYGAFMTANLLAHSDLFKAGIARSGAYNRTLTPFGFQGERRTLWEAPETYLRMSPFLNADKINEPILLIHGELDKNSGTFPIQSERLYQAMRGTGGRARFVSLPYESHSYVARESIEHTLFEMISWFDKHVKKAGPITARVEPADSEE